MHGVREATGSRTTVQAIPQAELGVLHLDPLGSQMRKPW